MPSTPCFSFPPFRALTKPCGFEVCTEIDQHGKCLSGSNHLHNLSPPYISSPSWNVFVPDSCAGFFVPHLAMIHPPSPSSWANYRALANLAVNNLLVTRTHFVRSSSQAYPLALNLGLTLPSTHVTAKVARLG